MTVLKLNLMVDQRAPQQLQLNLTPDTSRDLRKSRVHRSAVGGLCIEMCKQCDYGLVAQLVLLLFCLCAYYVMLFNVGLGV